MAKRYHATVLAALFGIVAGILVGASAVQYANLSAYSLEHRDSVYRNPRSVDAAKTNGFEDEGQTGIRLEWGEQRVENSARGAALEDLPMYCPGQSTQRRSRCLLNTLDSVLQELQQESEGE